MSFIDSVIKYVPEGNKSSTFNFIIYSIKDKYHSIIEDPNTHRMKIISNDQISNYLQLHKISTDWLCLFDNEKFIRIENNETLYYTFPLFENEYNRLQLNFMLPRRQHFKSEKGNFKSENFELTILENVSSTGTKTDRVDIKANLPVFKLFTMVELSQSNQTLRDYSIFLFMSIKDKFYSFPYGNIMGNDQMCLGGNSRSYKLAGFDKDLKKLILLDIVSTYFNHEATQRAKPSASYETTLDYNLIKNKIDDNNFSISFIDFLYYLAETADEQINTDLFIPVQNPSLISLQEHINRLRGR